MPRDSRSRSGTFDVLFYEGNLAHADLKAALHAALVAENVMKLVRIVQDACVVA